MINTPVTPRVYHWVISCMWMFPGRPEGRCVDRRLPVFPHHHWDADNRDPRFLYCRWDQWGLQYGIFTRPTWAVQVSSYVVQTVLYTYIIKYYSANGKMWLDASRIFTFCIFSMLQLERGPIWAIQHCQLYCWLWHCHYMFLRNTSAHRPTLLERPYIPRCNQVREWLSNIGFHIPILVKCRETGILLPTLQFKRTR